MEGMSDARRASLTEAVEQLASTAAREMLDRPDPEPRQLWLASLTSLLAIRDSAEQLAASAALHAAQHGADYPAIGDAAGMTRQGARRKWPGLAGLSDERVRKIAWWNEHRDEFARGARAVLKTSPKSPHLAALRQRLHDIEQASPVQQIDAFELALVDAHTVAVGVPAPDDPAAAHASGLLAALVADAYAAAGSMSRITGEDPRCRTRSCTAPAIVELWRPGSGNRPVPACRRHAVQALKRSATRIVGAYDPGTALSVFAEAHGQRPATPSA
jgi:hypothetical protein